MNVETKYFRPETRGGLKKKLLEGIPCEVVTSNVEVTNLLLRGWLDFNEFVTEPSHNEGWTVYKLKE